MSSYGAGSSIDLTKTWSCEQGRVLELDVVGVEL